MLNRINKRLHKKTRVISQINVTPFVDVMLVLLIVFMITAPLLTVGVSVDLPKTKASQLTLKVIRLLSVLRKMGNYTYKKERLILFNYYLGLKPFLLGIKILGYMLEEIRMYHMVLS